MTAAHCHSPRKTHDNESVTLHSRSEFSVPLKDWIGCEMPFYALFSLLPFLIENTGLLLDPHSFFFSLQKIRISDRKCQITQKLCFPFCKKPLNMLQGFYRTFERYDKMFEKLFFFSLPSVCMFERVNTNKMHSTDELEQ